jgi:outer membrane receptor protein involved in Fe transport
MFTAAAFLAMVVLAAAPTPTPTASPAPIGTVTVVTGSPQSLHKAPQAASVLSAQALQESTASSLDAALRDLPGFDRSRGDAPFTNYGQLRLSFAGAGQDRGALLVDGVPAQDGFGGQVDWNLYSPLAIARAELLRGPGSALYGSGAIGGVLSLFTTRPSLQSGGLIEGSFGGEDHGGSVVTTTGAIGSWASAVTLSTDRLAFDDVPHAYALPVDRTAISTADVAHVRLEHGSASNEITLDALVGTDAQQDGQPNDGFSRALDQLAASWTTGTVQTLALSAFTRETKLTDLADNTTTHPGALLYTQEVPTSDAGVRARWDDPVAGGDYTLIAERRIVTGWNDQISAANVVQSNIAGTQGLDGIAAQRTWDGRFGAVLGARYDAVHTDALGPRYAAAVSPRLDTKYDLSSATTLRAGFGTGLRAPFLNELIRSYRIGSTTYENNPDLAPERSRSAQVGFDVVSPNSRLAVDYTGTIVHDALGFSTITPTLQRRSNFGETETNALTGEYTRGGPCEDVRLFGIAQHDRVTEGTPAQVGKRLAYIPDEAAAVDLERHFGPMIGALEFSYSGPTFADSLQQQPIGTAFLVGARVTWQTPSGTSVALGLDNLTDRVYLTTIDRLGPPSSLTLRVTQPIGARVKAARAATAACN